MNITLDILINEIFPLLSVVDIKQLCQSQQQLKNICQEERLWEKLLIRDFADTKPENLSWYDFYIESHKYRNLIATYTEIPTKPSDISYFEYYKLLERTNKVKLTKYEGRNKIDFTEHISIIPEVTTIGALLDNIDSKVNIPRDYIIDFIIYKNNDNRGQIEARIYKYEDKYSWDMSCIDKKYNYSMYLCLSDITIDPTLNIRVIDTYYRQYVDDLGPELDEDDRDWVLGSYLDIIRDIYKAYPT